MSNTMILETMEKPHFSVNKQTLATLAAIKGAVIFSQLFHVFGLVSGMGTEPMSLT